MAVIFYAISAAGNLLLLIPRSGPSVVSDPSGVQWSVRSITAASALVSILTMGTFALLGWVNRPGSDGASRVTAQSGLSENGIALG
jgi:hypothetical protein